jgi:hypothetical protein
MRRLPPHGQVSLGEDVKNAGAHMVVDEVSELLPDLSARAVRGAANGMDGEIAWRRTRICDLQRRIRLKP